MKNFFEIVIIGAGASGLMATDTNFNVETAPRRAGDPAVLIANCNKIKEKMKWKPKYNNSKLICQSAYDWEKSR